MKNKAKLIKPWYFLSVLIFILTIFFVFQAISFWSNYQSAKITAKNLIIDILDNKPENFDKNFDNWQGQVNKLERKLKQIGPIIKFLPSKYSNLLNQSKDLLNLVSQFNLYLPSIVGKSEPKTYFVLFQNNLELRPSGGFMGSYAKLKFNQGGLKDILIQDIYVPDGQIKGHVEPPWPIQQAFQQGFWKLRDSNWEPDFIEASRQISWFFEKGGEEKANAMIALNLLIAKDILKIVEPIKIPDYDYEITTSNLYQITQNEAEKNFFPGSTQKKDFLSALNKYLFFQLKSLDEKQILQLIRTFKKNLEQKQILVSINDPKIAKFFHQLNWNGSVKRNYLDTNDTIADYVYIVDTNLGANKANCCVQRKVSQTINLDQNNLIKEKLQIIYINKNPKTRADPPLFWGGVYENYLRVILPLEIENIEIKINNKPYKEKVKIEDNKNKKLKTLGFFVIVEPLSESLVEISYEKKADNADRKKYSLEIQKQPGLESYSHIIKFEDPKKHLLLEKEIIKDEKIDL